MKRPYQITGVILLLLAAYLVRESMLLRFYTSIGPGPGFFPLLVSVLLGTLGAIMFFQATFRPSEPMPVDFFASRAGYFRIGAIILSFVAAVILLKPLGFRLTVMGMLVFLLLTLGRQRLLVVIVVALPCSLGMYHLFVDLLMIPLPKGIWGF